MGRSFLMNPMNRNHLTIKEIVAIVDQLGTDGGGSIEVTGTWKGQPNSIWIEQTEWHDSPVCLVGGNGNDVSSLNPNDVSSVLDCVIGNYLDGDTFSIEEE